MACWHNKEKIFCCVTEQRFRGWVHAAVGACNCSFDIEIDRMQTYAKIKNLQNLCVSLRFFSGSMSGGLLDPAGWFALGTSCWRWKNRMLWKCRSIRWVRSVGRILDDCDHDLAADQVCYYSHEGEAVQGGGILWGHCCHVWFQSLLNSRGEDIERGVCTAYAGCEDESNLRPRSVAAREYQIQMIETFVSSACFNFLMSESYCQRASHRRKISSLRTLHFNLPDSRHLLAEIGGFSPHTFQNAANPYCKVWWFDLRCLWQKDRAVSFPPTRLAISLSVIAKK